MWEVKCSRLLVVVGWDDAVTYCTGGPPVFNGVEQVAVAPSGNVSIVVHNSDIPILVFDVSARSAKRTSSRSAPLERSSRSPPARRNSARSSTRPRARPTSRSKTRGVVTDATGQDWTMQAFTKFRVDFGAEELTGAQ